MKLVLKVVLVLSIMVTVVGCAGLVNAPVNPPPGLLFCNYRAPLDTGLDQPDLGSKKGESYCECYLGLFTFGDASRRAAMENGGISKVTYADYEMQNILGVYSKFTTIVYGD